MKAIDLEEKQEINPGYPFAFSGESAPAQVGFCPRGECVLVLSHGSTGLRYYPLDQEKSRVIAKKAVQTLFKNPNEDLFSVFIPFGFCFVDNNNVPEGDVLIMLTIAGTFDVATYKAKTNGKKEGNFERISETTAAR
eukprot:Awhi_evm2s13345